MQDIEIIIDRGYGEKKLIISEKFITADASVEDSLINSYRPDAIIFLLNGNFPPPFEKGSRVLKELKSSSGVNYSNWKLLIPLNEKDENFLKIVQVSDKTLEDTKSYWGVWVNDEEINNGLPLLIGINYPSWAIRDFWNKNGKNNEWLIEKLSLLYRIALSSVNLLKSFQQNSIKTLLIADLGGSLMDAKNDRILIHSTRIKIFSEVITNWLGNNIEPSKVIVSFGEGINSELLEKAWGEQAEINKDNESEFGEALKLRSDNAELCKRMISITLPKSNFNKLRSLLSEASSTFSNSSLTLATDLIQTRAITEALASELTKHFGLKSDTANLFAYTQRLEESNKISPWITSYLHVLRQLGNEAAHYKNETKRRPEKPVGKDLIVIHATLNRVLNFCLYEFENK